MSRALEQIGDAKERAKISKEAGSIVAGAAERKAPKSSAPHYSYSTPKVISSRRAKRGSAKNFRIKYLPGNLKFSIRELKLKRSVRAIIGPKYLRNPRAKTYGKNRRNVNAYYAQMIYGSARAFRKKIMEPALLSKSSEVQAFIQREARRLIARAAKRNNLQ